MVQLTRLFVISRMFFMGFLISGAAIAQTSPIVPVSPANNEIDAAAPNDAIGQAIQATLEPLRTAFPPVLTSKRHQRVDVDRVVMDFYMHRHYRAAWTDDRDVTQLLKSLNDTQIDGLNPADFRITELAQAHEALVAAMPSTSQRAMFDMAATRTFITALLQLRREKSIRRGWISTGISTRPVSIPART